MKLYLLSLSLVLMLHQTAFCDAAADKQKKELNDAMAQRAEVMIKSHKAREHLNRAWADKDLTSPEIEKLRKRYQQLKFEMIEVREKLKAEIQKLPEVKELQRRVEDMNAKQKTLEKKIEKLKK